MIFENFFVKKNVINNFFRLFTKMHLNAPKRLKRPLSCARHFKYRAENKLYSQDFGVKSWIFL